MYQFMGFLGASISNAYLDEFSARNRYDRYQMIYNNSLANSMLNFIRSKLLIENSMCLNNHKRYSRILRKKLKASRYYYHKDFCHDQLSIAPILGLDISKILSLNKTVEIIVGDKIANDFYNSDKNSFKIISIIPYLYEINLRNFMKNYQNYIDSGNLIIKLWKNKNNSFHVKGIWVDKMWMLLTGNNFNARAWALDLENAILIHDPKQEIYSQQKLLVISGINNERCVHPKIKVSGAGEF
uniref:CDP-diacylglycerol--glycerol-3-phosphate 3-phosphatidyltransferase n=1 Tax=Glossina austeni TaxID=7395 RepID=A0A1A9UK62_GLOAU